MKRMMMMMKRMTRMMMTSRLHLEQMYTRVGAMSEVRSSVVSIDR